MRVTDRPARETALLRFCAASAGNGRPVSDVDVTLRVNGTEHDLTVDARTTLLDALRDRLGLTGNASQRCTTDG